MEYPADWCEHLARRLAKLEATERKREHSGWVARMNRLRLERALRG